jgi:Zn-dependent protease/predicted transcriptional regulator
MRPTLRSSVKLGTIFGVPVGLNFSWFFTFAFVTLILGIQVYPAIFEDTAVWVHWLMAVASGILFFASILTHEMAHSLIARAYGIPVKGITLFIFGGVSQITRDAKRPFAEFVMAAAGPATSILLSGFFLFLWWASGGGGRPIEVMWQWLWIMNLGLGAFNLAPGFPMDGGRIVRSALWGITGNYLTATLWASRGGRLMAYGLMLLGFAALVRLITWLEPFSGVWLMLLGLFLEGAARQSWRQVQALEVLRRYRAVDVMTLECPMVPRDATLHEVAQLYAEGQQRFCLFVTEGEHVVGMLTHEQVRPGPGWTRRWDVATAGESMTNAALVPVVAPQDDAASVLQTMNAADLPCLPVVEGKRLVGVVGQDALTCLLAARKVVP